MSLDLITNKIDSSRSYRAAVAEDKKMAVFCSREYVPCRYMDDQIRSDKHLHDYLRHHGIRIVMVNPDQQPDIHQELGIKRFPATLFYRDGVELDRVEGPRHVHTLMELMDKAYGLPPMPGPEGSARA